MTVTGLPGAAGRRPGRPHIVCFGNEKGGSGKSTTAMHVVVALLRDGHRVATLDLDARQGTLSRFLANRAASGMPLAMPVHRAIERSARDSVATAAAEEADRLDRTLAELADQEFIVVDTPGNDSNLMRLGHARADTLITPLNDSFVDLDLLAHVDAAGQRVLYPSLYAEMVWEQKKQRAQRDGGSIDWIVMRNRLATLDARNKRRVGGLIEQLAKRIGFRLAPGFSERVIFRELFLKGLTLLDLAESGTEMTLSHVAARQELRGLLDTIGLVPAAARKVG